MFLFDKGWSEIRTAFDRRLAFLNRVGLDQEALPEQLTQDAAVARAVRELDRAGLSAAEREIYDGEVKKKMVDAIQIRSAKQEGIQIGTEQGIQQGLQRSLLRQMTRRLGEIPANVSSQLQSLSPHALDELDLALPDLHTYRSRRAMACAPKVLSSAPFRFGRGTLKTSEKSIVF